MKIPHLVQKPCGLRIFSGFQDEDYSVYNVHKIFWKISCEKTKKRLAFFVGKWYYNQAWLHKICDEAGGCGWNRPVFPWSMSDFKPGEKYSAHRLALCKQGLALRAWRDECHPDFAFPQKKVNPVFKCSGWKHPKRCKVFQHAARQLLLRRRFMWQSRRKSESESKGTIISWSISRPRRS